MKNCKSSTQMELKTKYNIGDAVYILVDYKIQRANIASIGIDVVGDHKTITYRFPIFPMRRESQCFKSKEELIKFLSK